LLLLHFFNDQCDSEDLNFFLLFFLKFYLSLKKKASEEDNLKSQLNELPNKEAELSSNEIEYKKFIYSKFSRLLRISG
jgi:hypothetical protein